MWKITLNWYATSINAERSQMRRKIMIIIIIIIMAMIFIQLKVHII